MQLPDAEELIRQLAGQMRGAVPPDTGLVGIHTGGGWLAERLHAMLSLTVPFGVIDVSFYRDDYRHIGLHADPRQSTIPFDIDGRRIVIVDDVLYTGRTIRAAMNELFDYGRPARIDLAVLVDRGGRELPICANWCAHAVALAPNQNLQLERDGDGAFSLRVIEAK